jgi:hypothetical protein
MTQLEEQPSPSVRLPSSQASKGWTSLFPHSEVSVISTL